MLSTDPIKRSRMKTSHSNQHIRLIEKTGIVLVAVSVFVLLLTFYPVIKEELKYQLFPQHKDAVVVTQEEEKKQIQAGRQSEQNIINPVDENFSIVVPKIDANAVVIPGVNWEDATIYQQALTKGVAHALGSSYPDEPGNVFIFAHSGVDFYEAVRYNAQFYLLDKLVPGDVIYLFYKKQKYTYQVAEKKVVAPENVEYMTGSPDKKTLTLMTCSPAGTTWRRLIIIADQAGNN